MNNSKLSLAILFAILCMVLSRMEEPPCDTLLILERADIWSGKIFTSLRMNKANRLFLRIALELMAGRDWSVVGI